MRLSLSADGSACGFRGTLKDQAVSSLLLSARLSCASCVCPQALSSPGPCGFLGLWSALRGVPPISGAYVGGKDLSIAYGATLRVFSVRFPLVSFWPVLPQPGSQSQPGGEAGFPHSLAAEIRLLAIDITAAERGVLCLLL